VNGSADVHRTEHDTDTTSSPWHAMPLEEVIDHLSSDAEHGLSADESARRLEEHGANELQGDEGTPWWTTLLDQFRSPLITILLAAGVLTFVLGDYVDTAVIAAVLILNASIGFFQERRAEGSVLALMDLVSPDANVVRDGRQQQIDASEVVPGDIVVLESGQRVPADVRLISTNALQLDESLLTGESVPVGKGTEPVADDTPLADRIDMGFSGSIVASGRASGIVVATGEDSELGQIAEQMRETEELTSPLQERMDRFAKIIGVVIVGSAVLTVGLGLLLGHSLDDMLSVAAAVAVAAVPEGLPVVLTVALALGVRRMADRNAIIRRLPAVETLGSTTIIGSDKTGTLTRNQMSVEELWSTDRHRVLAQEGLPTDPRDADPRDVPGADAEVDDLAILAGVLANEGGYELTDDGVETEGDPTEAAFLIASARHGVDPNAARETWTETAGIPFESALRYAASYRERDGRYFVFVKGAPERVLEMCTEHDADATLDQAPRARYPRATCARDRLRRAGRTRRRPQRPTRTLGADLPRPARVARPPARGRRGGNRALPGCRPAGDHDHR
jgi:magnesium-transporting ATPase (P-type)